MMLVTVLTLPVGAGEMNQAVCGSLRLFRAVDAKAAGKEACNSGAIARGSLNVEKEGRAGVYKAVEGAKKEERVAKIDLSLPMTTGLNVSDEDQWLHFWLTPKLRCFLNWKGVFGGGNS